MDDSQFIPCLILFQSSKDGWMDDFCFNVLLYSISVELGQWEVMMKGSVQ